MAIQEPATTTDSVSADPIAPLTLPRNTILVGDALMMLRKLPSRSVQCVITSPPYFALRSYLPDNHPDKGKEMGSEATLEEYLDNMLAIFDEVHRVLRPDGVCWVNIGDSYAGSKTEDEQSKRPARGNRRMRLRQDLTPDELRYVLSELAKARSISAATQEGRE